MSCRFFKNYDNFIITSKFGKRLHPVDKVYKTHNGIDLVATKDGKVGHVDYLIAHTGGTVVANSYDSSSGNYVKIKVAPNSEMVYCHLKECSSLKVGSAVKKGDVIGYMGKTGKATGAHLHFGIKAFGKWIDPAPYLNADYVEKTETAEKKISTEVAVLRKGSKNENVKALQALLIGYGYKMENAGKTYGVDGSFGKATENAVKKYQTDKKLSADGVVGPATWKSLFGN